MPFRQLSEKSFIRGEGTWNIADRELYVVDGQAAFQGCCRDLHRYHHLVTVRRNEVAMREDLKEHGGKAHH